MYNDKIFQVEIFKKIFISLYINQIIIFKHSTNDYKSYLT